MAWTGVTTPGVQGLVSNMTCWAATTGHGECIYMPVGDISKVEGWEDILQDQVPAFSTWWIVQFLRNGNEVATFQPLCALSLNNLHSSSEEKA